MTTLDSRLRAKMSFHKHIIDTLVDQMPNATNNHYAERGRRIRIGRLAQTL